MVRQCLEEFLELGGFLLILSLNNYLSARLSKAKGVIEPNVIEQGSILENGAYSYLITIIFGYPDLWQQCLCFLDELFFEFD